MGHRSKFQRLRKFPLPPSTWLVLKSVTSSIMSTVTATNSVVATASMSACGRRRRAARSATGMDDCNLSANRQPISLCSRAFGSGGFRHRRQNSSCCQDSEDDRGFPQSAIAVLRRQHVVEFCQASRQHDRNEQCRGTSPRWLPARHSSLLIAPVRVTLLYVWHLFPLSRFTRCTVPLPTPSSCATFSMPVPAARRSLMAASVAADTLGRPIAFSRRPCVSRRTVPAACSAWARCRPAFTRDWIRCD